MYLSAALECTCFPDGILMNNKTHSHILRNNNPPCNKDIKTTVVKVLLTTPQPSAHTHTHTNGLHCEFFVDWRNVCLRVSGCEQ